MDIRTKLVFALVAVALGSMLVFGVLTYNRAGGQLRAAKLNQLDGLAEFKKEAVEGILEGWTEQVRLVSSRTRLRASLREYGRDADVLVADEIQRILTDAAQGGRVDLSVYGTDGRVVASTILTSELSESLRESTRRTATYQGVSVPDSGPPRVTFTSGLELEGEPLGFLSMVISADDLIRFARNYRGLGETGETMLVVRDQDGAPRVLHPVRHDPEAGTQVVGVIDGSGSPAALALSGQEGVFSEDLTDYAGNEVWAATRFLPQTAWGVVVKVDAAEEEEPIVTFRSELTDLALILAAFASVVGVILGVRFSQPIRDLAEVTDRVRGGDLGARAEIGRQDEVGALARTFNEMADELEERMTLLREFRKFFDVAVELMCIGGTDGYFKRTNPAFQKTLGWTSEELLSRQFYDFVHPDDVEATEREVAQLAEGIPTISFENRYLCADGTYKRLRWYSTPDPDTGLLYATAHVIEP